MDQMFLGALVLDLSDRTNKQHIADVLNLLAAPFDNTQIADLIERPVFEPGCCEAGHIVSGFCMMSSMAPPDVRFIPTKTACAMSWLAGDVSNVGDIDLLYRGHHIKNPGNAQEAATKALLRLNSDKHAPQQFDNYTHRAHVRVTGQLEGRYATTLAYLGPRPALVLACNERQMYSTVISIDRCLVLIWSSEQDAVTSIITAVDDAHPLAWVKQQCWVHNMAIFGAKKTLAIHPMFLLSKVRHLGLSSQFNHVKVMPKIEAYLTRGAY